jgi:hypothetical protein
VLKRNPGSLQYLMVSEEFSYIVKSTHDKDNFRALNRTGIDIGPPDASGSSMPSKRLHKEAVSESAFVVPYRNIGEEYGKKTMTHRDIHIV